MGIIDRLFARRPAVGRGISEAADGAGPAVVPVSRYGSLIALRPDFEERYCILHRHTFPGVLERIRKCNLRNYSIFLAGGTLFGHYEYLGREYDADMKAMADPVTTEWWKLTAPMQIPLRGRKEGEWWASMTLLAHSGGEVKGSSSVRRGAIRAQIGRGGEERFRGSIQSHRQELLAAFRRHGFQNVCAYYFAGWLYVYFEQTGGVDPASSPILEETVLTTLRRELRPTGSRGTRRPGDLHWELMREVFHTD